MEAKKSHHLPPAGWRPRKAGGVGQRPESQRTNGVDSSPGLKAWGPGMLRAREDSVLAPQSGRERIQPSSSCSLQALYRLEEACPHWEGPIASDCLTSQTLVSSRNTLINAPRICLTRYLVTLWPSQVDSKINLDPCAMLCYKCFACLNSSFLTVQQGLLPSCFTDKSLGTGGLSCSREVATVRFPKELHYKLLWFRLWLGNSTQALMPRPHHAPVLPTLTAIFKYYFTPLFSSVPSIAFRDCWELPEQRRLFSLLGFLAAVLSNLQRQEGGTCSRKPIAYPCVREQPAQQPTAGAWPGAQWKPSSSSLRVSRYFAWHSHGKQTGQQSSSISSRPLSGKCENLKPLSHTLEPALPPDLALPNLPS